LYFLAHLCGSKSMERGAGGYAGEMRSVASSASGLIGLAVGLGVAAGLWGGAGRTASANQPPLAVVAILSSPVGAENTDLIFQPLGAPDPAPPAATLHHAPGAIVRGQVLVGTRAVVVVADMLVLRDPSWGASLTRLEPAHPALTLVDRVYHASRPLVTTAGRVFVLRGRAGPDPTPDEVRRGELRTDELTIDEVDPSTGVARTVHSYAGYIAYLAGSLGDEIFVYRVALGHADIVAVDVNSGSARVLVPSILPFARDFSVDPVSRSLLFAERDERSTDIWVAERLDLVSGNRTRIATATHMSLLPHVWPQGRVALNADGIGGLSVVGSAGAAIRRPLGDGVDAVRGFSLDGQWAAVRHERSGEPPSIFALRTDTGSSLPIATPRGARIDVAGFVR
jgi:hypothetical protein